MKHSRFLSDYTYGLRRGLPIVFGFLPVAVTFAVMSSQAGLNAAETIGMSAAVFAGASQIMAVGMVSAGADILAITLATFVLNLRHIIMSTCVFRRLTHEKRRWYLPIGFGVTDETFAFFSLEKRERASVGTMLGLITVAYSSWVGGTVLGTFLSTLLPDALANSLGIALYALFIALVTPDIKKSLRLLLVVVLTVALNVGFGFVLPKSWAIIAATLIGAGLGVFFVEDSDLGMVTDPETGGIAS